MALSGKHLETIVKLITEAFNKSSLAELVRFKLGADIFKEWASENDPLKTIVFKVVTKLDEEGRVAALLDHVIVARLDRPDVSGPLAEIRQTMDTKMTTSGDQAKIITDTVQELAEKLNLPPVHKIMEDSRGVLEKLTAKIDLLRAYKALHDVLHNAKMNFRRLESSARQMAADPTRAADFSETVAMMETLPASIDSAIQDLPADPANVRQDEADWLARFRAAITVARQAADAPDPVAVSGDARQSARDIASILATDPTRIDGKLSRTANEIDLTRLRDVFTSVAALPELASKAAMFQESRAATELLLGQLKAQVNQHATWQSVDRRLTGADEAMQRASAKEPWDFDGLWKALKENIASLVAVEPQSEWAKKIAGIIVNVDTVRGADDWVKLPREFSRFRQEATVQFFVVDSRLKMLASEVNIIGAPLRSLLDQL